MHQRVGGSSTQVAAGRVRVLLLEPRHIYAARLTHHLRQHEFAVEIVHSEATALDELRNGDPDVVVVCVGTHSRGIKTLDRIRRAADVNVVALTDADVVPLSSGSGLTHAPGIETFITRIRKSFSQTRNHSPSPEPATGIATQPHQIGDLLVDVAARRVMLRGKAVALTRIEFCILSALATCPGEPLSRRELLDAVWGDSWSGSRAVLDGTLAKLRRKLGDDSAAAQYVRTVRGVGYCLDA